MKEFMTYVVIRNFPLTHQKERSHDQTLNTTKKSRLIMIKLKNLVPSWKEEVELKQRFVLC